MITINGFSGGRSLTNKISLSIPAAKPSAGVGGPPSCSARLSYLPPAAIVPWEPISWEINSKTVCV